VGLRAGALTLVVGRNAMVSDADAGAQPHMEGAFKHLEAAKRELSEATADKAGHRAKAITLVEEALRETKLGIEAGEKREEKEGQKPAPQPQPPSAPSKPKTEPLQNPK
jgi:hypothetical protein